MSEEKEPQESRRHVIKIPVPWSSNPVEIRGYDILLVLVVASVPFAAYFLYEIKTDSHRSHTQILEALTVHTYVLSLPQDKREALNISMPESLRNRTKNRRGGDSANNGNGENHGRN